MGMDCTTYDSKEEAIITWINGRINQIMDDHIWVHDEESISCIYFEERDGMWCYDEISELEGPTHVDCPISFLSSTAKAKNLTASEWRKEVLQFHMGS